MWNKTLLVLKQIQLSSHICFIPLPTALLHDIICVFRTQNNKSNDPYLLVMAHCNYRTRSWTIQTLGPCPQCTVRSEQENRQVFKQSSLRKTCMEKFLLMFKDTGSMSSIEVGLLYGIPVMLRQQQCWKFASARRNVQLATSWTVRGSISCGARFSAPVQTGPVVHLASCRMGTGSIPGKAAGAWGWPPTPSGVEVMKE